MDGIVKTPNGFEYNVVNAIQNNWSEYDTMIAKIHLMRYGKIIIDEFNTPVDNEYILMEIESYIKDL